MTTSIDVITFGCRLNTFESEVMRRHAQAAGLADLVIVHTCAVTAEAERQARQAIRRARRERPTARIVVTGCAAQITPDAYAAIEGVDRLVGNDRKLSPATWQALADGAPETTLIGDIMAVREPESHAIDGIEGRTRAFLSVQNGCDHRCTFCVIPYGRGNSRSLPLGDVLQQARQLVAAGHRELVLTGVDLTSYGKDQGGYGEDQGGQPTLGRLVGAILDAVPELPRLRLSSLDPAEIDPLLFDHLASESRLMPHVHLSLQAGDDLILKRMKRRHLRADVIDLCQRLRNARPDIVFGADMIAGFPTETEQMFDQSLNIVGEAGLTFLHVFPYSPRPGTPASRMPQLPKQLVKERAQRLRAMGETALESFLVSQIGQRRRVLVERQSRGHTQHMAPIQLATPTPAGTMADVEVTGTEMGMLVGSVAA
jgi:threonylcarbamoyladenosine tRNA methylthiotransferase MtaB